MIASELGDVLERLAEQFNEGSDIEVTLRVAADAARLLIQTLEYYADPDNWLETDAGLSAAQYALKEDFSGPVDF